MKGGALMKAKYAFLLMAVLLAVPAVFAQEEIDTNTGDVIITNDTEAEIETMIYPHGAEIRILQLEKAITRNIERGDKVIEALNSTSNETLINDLQAVIDELEVLKTEVQSFVFEGNVSEITKKFVDLKADAVELSKKFRTLASGHLSAEQRIQLQEEFQNQGQEELAERIRHKINEYNALRLENFLNLAGLQNSTFVQQARNGEVNAVSIMSRLKANIMQMNMVQKKQAVLEVQEEVLRNKVKKDAAINEAKANFTERKFERLESRVQNLTGDNLTQIMQQIQSRITSTNELREALRSGRR